MDKITRIYKALADKNRLRILKLLELKPFCVCELTKILGIAQSILKEAGLVEDKKESYWVNYYLAKHAREKAAKEHLKVLSNLLDDDASVKRDREKAKRVNRETLR